ncbi:hypothetical protein QYE76_058745 [Lolium multiflorum]|uniref:Disease resistance protein At4g27190-like leucine-rich repeats domain-containing protein n=1 Tax=Lolium multiflorum TaxID=4521 RepID=A0AAD8WQ99_LOLMU|nr:hypothetical protein QYE76_058745 [Lolium multiflorum]
MQFIVAEDIGEVLRKILRYLEDTSSSAPNTIYYDGWGGLGASAVLRAIAQDPPLSLMKKFSKIIHVDCSKWKSRRALQRIIAQELELLQGVMAIFDKQDEEDDFSGIDEGSRAEIGYVGRRILRVLMEHRCLVVFHNGSNDMVDFSGFGIPQPELFGTIVLWTFRGRLRLNQGINKKVDNSHLYLHNYVHNYTKWNLLLHKEVSEIAQYTCKLGATPEIAEECCLYLLSLNNNGGDIMDYNWVTHASNYWVCDGIIQAGGPFDQAWEVAAALHQEIHLEDYSSNTLSDFGHRLRTPQERWIFATKSTVEDSVTLPRESTSFFFVDKSGSGPPLASLPNGMFHQSDMLRVLRLCRCTFNFSSPPFHCCRNLRFLGLDLCKDQPQSDDEKKEISEMDYVQSLWVVDICNTDWELTQSTEIIEQMSAKIREVHTKKGLFWHRNFAWGKLKNLLKLRVIEPTSPWETREMDGFTDMVKLELLDLSKNTAIHVLPSLLGAASLKTLVLDGCVGLEHVEGLPPSLESFSLAVGEAEKMTHISMAGCARMVDFTLCGSFPRLEELDLSGTKVKTLDLKDQVVHVPHLQRVMLLGCEQLCAILWPEKGMPHLSVLCIDTRGGGGGAEVRRILPDSKKLTYFQSYVAMTDMRFIQSLVLRSCSRFCWNTNKFNLHLCISGSSTNGGQTYNKEKMGPSSIGKIIGPPLPNSSILNPSYHTYTDVTTDSITIDPDYNSAPKFQPLGRCHVEIGEEIINTNVQSVQGIKPIIFVMNEAESLHVHDNSSITTIISQHMISIGVEREIFWRHLTCCLVERCPKLHTVFTTNYNIACFHELETFWAADLRMAHCIWSKGRMDDGEDTDTFAKLRSIHLYCCPRLTFILPLSWFYTLSSLETLHIVNCGDLRQVFPVEVEFLRRIATNHQDGVLEFPKLKHIYLHELYKLQHICEAKMFAPKLEKVRLRGCWGLRRLPAVGQESHPVVDCEKDWWDKLEWDGLEAGHHPSLFEPCHSSYYKKPLPRVSVLR